MLTLNQFYNLIYQLYGHRLNGLKLCKLNYKIQELTESEPKAEQIHPHKQQNHR